jgi:hypothetical protein
MLIRLELRRLFKVYLISLLIIFEISSLPLISQGINRINLEDIPQRGVRKYITSRSINRMNDFSLLHASWKKGINEPAFKVMEKTFNLKYKLSNVWRTYLHTNPAKMWNRHSARLGLLISKCNDTVLYTNNPSLPEIDTGQVYFISMKILKGIVNIPAAFEIINIDPKQQMVEFSYLDNNKSLGKQTLQFFDNGEDRTRIVHRSYFKSSSLLRDDIFYPYFHNKFIKKFHRNMKHIIKKNEFSASVLN